MPRLTYEPSVELRGRAGGHLVAGERHVSSLPGWRYGTALDALLDAGADFDDAVDVDAGQMDLIGVELAGLDELFDLGDADAPGHCGERVEVAGGLVEDEVAVPVTFRSACTSAKSVTIASSSTYSCGVPDDVEGADVFHRRCDGDAAGPSYLRGRPPSATCVPTPVWV